MKRIATIIAIATLALGASATTASARLPIDGDEAAVAVSSAHSSLPAKTVKHDSRPAKVVYRGRH